MANNCNRNRVNNSYKELTVSEELDQVQKVIECCLEQYMSLDEVVDTLNLTFDVAPAYTKLVWQELAEQNPEFFKQYNIRLILKNQIQEFNTLLEKQSQLMSNRSQVPPFYSESMVSDESPMASFIANVSHNNTYDLQNLDRGMMQGINKTSVESHMLANGGPNLSSSKECPRVTPLPDFGDLINFDDLSLDGIGEDDFAATVTFLE